MALEAKKSEEIWEECQKAFAFLRYGDEKYTREMRGRILEGLSTILNPYEAADSNNGSKDRNGRGCLSLCF